MKGSMGSTPERAATPGGAMTQNISGLVDVLLDRGKFTRTKAIAIAVAGTAFALVFCYPLGSHLWILSTPNDWDLIAASQWAAYRTVREYHQFPLWNPFECGGLDAGAMDSQPPRIRR